MWFLIYFLKNPVNLYEKEYLNLFTIREKLKLLKKNILLNGICYLLPNFILMHHFRDLGYLILRSYCIALL